MEVTGTDFKIIISMVILCNNIYNFGTDLFNQGHQLYIIVIIIMICYNRPSYLVNDQNCSWSCFSSVYRVTHQYPDAPISGHLYLLNGRALVFVFIPKDSSLYDGLATGKRAAVGGACANGGAKYAPSEKINIQTMTAALVSYTKMFADVCH